MATFTRGKMERKRKRAKEKGPGFRNPKFLSQIKRRRILRRMFRFTGHNSQTQAKANALTSLTTESNARQAVAVTVRSMGQSWRKKGAKKSTYSGSISCLEMVTDALILPSTRTQDQNIAKTYVFFPKKTQK